MAKSNVLGYLFAVIVGFVAGGFILRSCDNLPDGKLIVDKSAIDSLNAFISITDSIKSLPKDPVITSIDTIYIDRIVHITSDPIAQPDPVDDNITHFNDSLVIKDTISVWVDILARGHTEGITLNWKYKPTIREIKTNIETPVYYPVIETIDKEIPTYYTGHYLSFAAGGSSNLFTFGLDYTITKENYMYGLEYRRYGNQNVYGFQAGVNLRTLFKKKR